MNPLEPWLWEAIVKLQAACAAKGLPLASIKLLFEHDMGPVDFTAFSSVGAIGVEVRTVDNDRINREARLRAAIDAVEAAVK